MGEVTSSCAGLKYQHIDQEEVICYEQLEEKLLIPKKSDSFVRDFYICEDISALCRKKGIVVHAFSIKEGLVLLYKKKS